MIESLQQLHTPGPDVEQSVDVEGLWDERRQVLYMGIATKQPNGKWRCLAQVYGMLCIVEARITIGATSRIVFGAKL